MHSIIEGNNLKFNILGNNLEPYEKVKPIFDCFNSGNCTFFSSISTATTCT